MSEESHEPAVPATPVTPELRAELAEYGVRLPQMVGTEDDRHGGLSAVLARTLEHYGLPPHAGLTGLLRHLEGNRAMSEGALHLSNELLRARADKQQARLDELEAEVRAARDAT